MKKLAIRINNISKMYRLYNSHLDRVKETFHPLRKQYHRPHYALQEISLEIEKGEFVGIIGRNGSGKSTLLQLMSKVLTPTSGSLEINGTLSALLELGAGFNPEFTGRENVYLNGSILGIAKEEIERLFPRIESFADIGQFIDQPVKTYSSGMFVRLAFAVAISVRPEILIVDEALAVGDIFFQQKCIKYMEEEMSNSTKVLVTHDMHAVMNLCERVFLLDHGKLVFEGSPIEGVEHYTKMMQNELFQKKPKEENTLSGNDHTSYDESAHADGWVLVEKDEMAGASDITIERVRLTSSVNGRPALTALPGDLLNLEIIIQVASDQDSILFGYMLKDRVGNGICGDNTLSLEENTVHQLHAGVHHTTLSFRWPAIAPDNYSITIGVGQGSHPLHHVIQCWAHNIIAVKGLSNADAVHGIFTNRIEECEVRSFE